MPPESWNWGKKGYAKKTGTATQQAQRCVIVGLTRLAIRGYRKSWKMSMAPPHAARACNNSERVHAKMHNVGRYLKVEQRLPRIYY